MCRVVCHVWFGAVLVGFFFFKQKTAYEMRISDWSSDVCSSDLCTEGCGLHASFDARLRAVVRDRRAVHRLRLACARTATAVDVGRLRAADGVHHARRDDTLRGRLRRRPRAAIPAGRTHQRVPGRAAVLRACRGLRWIREGGSVRHALYRSEEHTSELQSLMRISYAVFCLKKTIKIAFKAQNN